MAYPAAPEIETDYSAYEQLAGNGTFPGSELDVDLANLRDSQVSLRAFLMGIARSDGQLANGIVTVESLAPSVLAGFDPPSAWVTATAYTTLSAVYSGYGLYRCVVAHTSGVFATDLAAGRWELLADLTPPGQAIFGSRDATNAASLYAALDDGEIGWMGGIPYERDSTATGTASCTYDLSQDGLVPAFGVATPFHWGGLLTDDDTAGAINSAATWALDGYDSDAGAYLRSLDLSAGMWKVASGVNLTNIRQGGFTVNLGAGGLVATGGMNCVLDTFGTNNIRFIGPVHIQMPESDSGGGNVPTYGMSEGRAEYNGDPSPIAPNRVLEVFIQGMCKRAGLVNVGSEVERVAGQIVVTPYDDTTVGYANFGHQSVAVAQWGSEVASTFTGVTVPGVDDSPFSDICHNLSGLTVKMRSPYTLSIVDVSNANPGVIEVEDATDATEGDTVVLQNMTGITELEGAVYTIYNLNSGAGTFQIKDSDDNVVDTSAMGTFAGTNANVRKATGTAVLLGGGCKSLFMGPDAYILTYGAPSVTVDVRYGNIGLLQFQFQQEANPAAVFEFLVGTSTNLVVGFEADVLSSSQEVADCLVRVTKDGSGGAIRFDHFKLRHLNSSAELGTGIFSDPSIVNIRDADIKVYYEADAVQVINGSLGAFAGTVGWTGDGFEHHWFGQYLHEVQSLKFGNSDDEITDIVGTIDDSSGDVVGAMFEAGATGSYRYIRRPDGQQEVWGRVTLTYNSNTLLQGTFTFGKDFLSGTAGDIAVHVTPQLSAASLTPTGGDFVVGDGAISVSAATIQAKLRTGATSFGASDTLPCFVRAVGRWT